MKMIDSGDVSFRELSEANGKRSKQFPDGFTGGSIKADCERFLEKHKSADAVGFELAEIIIHADLCARRLGLSLGYFVRERFNHGSELFGSDEKL